MAKRTKFVQMDLLDLLAEIEARPVVVRMPTRHWGRKCWASKIVDAADLISTRADEMRVGMAWDGVTRAVREELTAAGALQEEIAAELGRFRQALTLELCRRGARHQSGPGAA